MQKLPLELEKKIISYLEPNTTFSEKRRCYCYTRNSQYRLKCKKKVNTHFTLFCKVHTEMPWVYLK